MSELLHRIRAQHEHRWALDHLSDYLDGELAASRHRRMQQHADRCPECHRHLAGLDRMLRALHHLPPPPGGADAARIAAAVRRRLGDPPAA